MKEIDDEKVSGNFVLSGRLEIYKQDFGIKQPTSVDKTQTNLHYLF